MFRVWRPNSIVTCLNIWMCWGSEGEDWNARHKEICGKDKMEPDGGTQVWKKYQYGNFSMISNFVTQLRNYTNSAIADIARNSVPILPETTHRCCCAEHRCLRIERRYRRIEWRVFECFVMYHNVLIVFHDVWQCFKCFVMFHVLRVFHDVLLVVNDILRHFTMFYKSFIMF